MSCFPSEQLKKGKNRFPLIKAEGQNMIQLTSFDICNFLKIYFLKNANFHFSYLEGRENLKSLYTYSGSRKVDDFNHLYGDTPVVQINPGSYTERPFKAESLKFHNTLTIHVLPDTGSL